MRTKSSADKMVHKTDAQLRPASEADLLRLRRGVRGPARAVDVPSRKRSATNHSIGFTPTKSRIRSAIVSELNRRRWSGYRLWKTTTHFCETLPKAAVYEFLRGERAIGLEYIEAMLTALDLQVGVFQRINPTTRSLARSA